MRGKNTATMITSGYWLTIQEDMSRELIQGAPRQGAEWQTPTKLPWIEVALHSAKTLLEGERIAFLTPPMQIGLSSYRTTAVDPEGYAVASLHITVSYPEGCAPSYTA